LERPIKGWQWAFGQGLFDIRPCGEMTIVQGAGWGGGSLIYANVHLRAPADLFQSGWPAGYSRAALDPYYDLVAYMLDIAPITASSHLGVPPKAQWMKQVADRLGRAAQFCYPNIAVDFSAPGVAHRNKFGVEQSGCIYCGECDIGCNVIAKNTLDLNYLALAEQHGADVAPLSEAVRIERDGTGYKVTFKNYAARAAESAIAARTVFLCAGAVNSTELLLRCRDEFKTLPALSARLGQGYSGNGDFLAFAFDTATPFAPSNGPTITTGIVYDRGAGADRVWFIFEEGGYPKEIAGLLQVLNPRSGWLKDVIDLSSDALNAAISVASRGRIGSGAPPHDDTAVFLAMGRDRANGVLALDPLTRALRVSWDVASNAPLYAAEEQFSTDVANAMGGAVALNPLWHRLHRPVSVHNLGGCVMADDEAKGVTDAGGEVFGYPGLYVLDGGALPAATGVNPSHTIAAVAERNVEGAIRKLTGNAAWRAPEAASAEPVKDPLAGI
jgi:cholesterol oxidase